MGNWANSNEFFSLPLSAASGRGVRNRRDWSLFLQISSVRYEPVRTVAVCVGEMKVSFCGISVGVHVEIHLLFNHALKSFSEKMWVFLLRMKPESFKWKESYEAS